MNVHFIQHFSPFFSCSCFPLWASPWWTYFAILLIFGVCSALLLLIVYLKFLKVLQTCNSSILKKICSILSVSPKNIKKLTQMKPCRRCEMHILFKVLWCCSSPVFKGLWMQHKNILIHVTFMLWGIKKQKTMESVDCLWIHYNMTQLDSVVTEWCCLKLHWTESKRAGECYTFIIC